MFLTHPYSGAVKKAAGSHPEEGSADCHLFFGAMLPISAHTLQRQVNQGTQPSFHLYLEDLKKRDMSVKSFLFSPFLSVAILHLS